MTESFTPAEREEVRKYFGKPLEELDAEEFKVIHRQLRTRYHPDNFEKFEDETVREMATERFQRIESLAAKIDRMLKGGSSLPSVDNFMHADARFAFDKMKIEVVTSDKDLKYHLFGTAYRWLAWGDKFKVPGTQAHIIIDEDHRGVRIGYRETIRMYLTFGPDDDLEAIIGWLYTKLNGRASSLLIEGTSIPVDRDLMTRHIKRTAFREIGPPR